jgi:predicted Zn-dependent protease
VNEIAQKLLALALGHAPKAQVTVRVEEGRSANTRFAAQDITTSGDTDASGVSLTVAIGLRHATGRTNRTDEGSLAALAERTVTMAKLLPEDPELMPVLGPQAIKPVPEAFDPATRDHPNEARAKAARDAIARCDTKGVAGAGFLSTYWSRAMLATSAGLSAEHASTGASFTMTARTPDGTGSGWWGAEETRVGAVDVGAVADQAIDRGVRSQKPRALAPGKYAVVLSPHAVGDLLTFFVESLDQRQSDEGRSFFSKGTGTRVGERLFPETIRIASDPHDPGTANAPFDDDGTPLEKTVWVERGTLRALSCSRWWAAQKGRVPTGSHATFSLAGGDASGVEALVKSTKRGLLVTRFWYTRWLDPRTMLVTGLTRDGVFLIENGQIAYPVNNFRFNESPAKMLASSTGLTRETWRVPRWGEGVMRVPALACSEFEMSSVSAAV